MFVISVLIPSSKCCVILLTTVYLLVMLKTLCLLVGKELPCDSHSFLTWHGLRNNQFVKYDLILKVSQTFTFLDSLSAETHYMYTDKHCHLPAVDFRVI